MASKTVNIRLTTDSPNVTLSPDAVSVTVNLSPPQRPDRPDWPQRPDRPDWPTLPSPPVSDFDPRTMTIEQIEAATGLQIPESELTQMPGMDISEGVWENIDFTGRVTLTAVGKKVLFRNCRFRSPSDWYSVINKPDEYLAQELRFEFCEMSNAQNTIAGAMMYLYRCQMTEWENGVNIWGPTQIVECYIHTPKQIADEPHYDAVECNGGDGHDIKVLRSYIWNSAGQTAALMFNNQYGALRDIEVDGNWLGGGGYTIYVDNRKTDHPVDSETMRFTNNTIKAGTYGHLSLYDSGVVIDEDGGNEFI